MKTSIEALSGTEKRIRVEIPADEVDRRIGEGFAEVRRLVPLRGFRKGKAPMAMVKRTFREHVEADVAEHLVKESLADAVKKNDLRILSMAKIDGGRLREGEGFVFTATVEVVPDVVPGEYTGIPVTREKVAVGDDDVAAALRGLRESFARYHAVEGRGARESDLVEFGYAATEGGEAIESVESTTLLMGMGVPLGKEFEGGLAGAVPGETRRFEVPFPADFRNPLYAGKSVAFEVRVAGVREKRLPDLDDEFAKNFGDLAGGIAELKEKMRERLLAEAAQRSTLRMEEEIRNGLLARHSFEVPKTLVDRQILSMIEETAKRMASQGIDLKKVNMDYEKMRERFAPNAERSVRVSLLLEAIAKRENIDVPYAEIEAEMKTIASAAGMEFEKVREIYGDEERMDDLRNRLVARKVMAFLLARADVREEGVAG